MFNMLQGLILWWNTISSFKTSQGLSLWRNTILIFKVLQGLNSWRSNILMFKVQQGLISWSKTSFNFKLSQCLNGWAFAKQTLRTFGSKNNAHLQTNDCETLKIKVAVLHKSSIAKLWKSTWCALANRLKRNGPRNVIAEVLIYPRLVGL